MKLIMASIMFFQLIVLACSKKKQVEKKIEHLPNRATFAVYQETPDFIRHYLDSVNGGKHWIANPGQNWNGGCVQIIGFPGCQFVTANIFTNYYVLTLRTGGIAPTTKFIVVQFSKKSILSYKIQSIYPFFEYSL